MLHFLLFENTDEVSLLNALRSADKHLCTEVVVLQWFVMRGFSETELSFTPLLFNF